MNLYEKIQAVNQDIKNIEKDMTVGWGKNSYKAVSDIAVVMKVKEAERKHKLLSIPIKQELISEKQVNTVSSGGKAMVYHAHTIKMTTKIINTEKTDEFIDVESFGFGWDTGDKGLGKASTYARKYALLNAYKIATGEDPDRDPSKGEEPIDIDDKVKTLTACYDGRGDDLQKALSHFKVNSLADLDAISLDTVWQTVKKRGWLDV